MDDGIRLCGRFGVELGGQRVEGRLPGRKGRLAVAYLAMNRERPVQRDELIDVLWPDAPPADPDEALIALLSKVRRAVGRDRIVGRRELTLALPDGATVDVTAAAAAVARAEAAVGACDWQTAWDAAAAARETVEGGFLPGADGAWVEDRRREVDELRIRALDCIAAAGTALGGARLPAAERAARELVAAAPFRESGHRRLMEALAAGGDVAEALQVYERLRVLLRDELGATPGAAAQALHVRLLSEGPAPDEAEPAAAPNEERKVVSALAIELTAARVTPDPEDLRAETDRVKGRLARQLDAFGGTLERLEGTAAVALFGARTAHEDDARRAIRAAHHLCQSGWASAIGVATGEALVTAAGVTGGVVLEAERLRRGDDPGCVAIDELTQRLARETRGERAGFVGRRHEMELLETLERTVLDEERPRLVAVIGQAGVGKTRLTEELITRVAATAVPYRGRCLPYGEGIAWWPLREILWQAAGILLADSAEEAAAKLRQRVRDLVSADAAERVACALAVSAGIALPANPLERMSPESVAEEVGLAWPMFLSALAAEAPAVVVIEDLHWAEQTLVEMVERIVDRSSGPLLVVATARPEFAESSPGWSSRPGMAQVGLDPLTERPAHELVAELLPAGDRALRDRVVAAAEGNPFFAEEIVRHIDEQGSDAASIPDSIRTLLAARIDRLDDGEKRVLQDAAVVGRSFWAPTLEAMGAGGRLGAALDALEAKGLVVTRPTSTLPGQTEMWFRHGLTREVAYRSIPRARRCRAHADVGAWIARLTADRREEFVDLLAHHYEAAALPPDADLAWPPDSNEREQVRVRAVDALLAAGHAARRRMALDEALRFAERGLALARSAGERLPAHELKARAYHAAVRGDEALAAYVDAIDAARDAGDRRAVERLRAHALLLCVRYAGAFSAHESWKQQAHVLLEDGLSATREAPTFAWGTLLLARSWGAARWSGSFSYDLAAAQRDAARAVEVAEEIDSPDLLGTALEGLTWLIFEDGLGEARALGERLLRSGEKLADLAEIHETLVTAAMCFAWGGDFERGATVAAEATSRAADLSPHRVLHAAAASTLCLAPVGRIAELREATGPLVELARDEGDRMCSTGTLGLAGRIWCLFESQDPAAADALDVLLAIWPGGPTAWYGHRGSHTYPAAELLRPFLPPAVMDAALARTDPVSDVRIAVQRLRTQLPVVALGPEPDRTAALSGQAHELAIAAPAPALGWIADWADGVRLARGGERAEGLARVAAASGALLGHGEHYTGARLVVDALPFLEGSGARRLAGLTAARLESMGALASAAEARALPDLGRGRAAVRSRA